MAKSFYASQLSKNIAKTPEGYLVCRDSIIARTGKQPYRVSEITRDLDNDVRVDLGLDKFSAGDRIDLFRDPGEVLDRKTLSSFEGKPVTDGHPSDPEGVNADNIHEYHRGHVQNVREMPGTLDSGEKAILADVIITDADLAARIENGSLREISCGYSYELARDGERLLQTAIRGNHVAIVPSGRAGAEVRIQDAAEPQEDEDGMANELFSKLLEAVEQLKDRLPARRAADAEDPEEKAEEKAEEKKEEPKAADKARDKSAAKDEPDSGAKPEQLKDAKRGYDTQHGEFGDKIHAAVDRLLDEMSKREQQPAEDADLEELRDLLNQFFEEEEEEPEHDDGGDDEDEHSMEADAEGEETGSSGFEPPDDDEGEKDDDAGADDAKDATRWPDRSRGDKRSKAAGYAKHSRSKDADMESYRAGALDALKEIRPAVTRHGSEKVKRAFQATMDRLQGSSRTQDGSYARFASAAAVRSRDAKESKQAYYDRVNAEAREALMNPGRKKT